MSSPSIPRPRGERARPWPRSSQSSNPIHLCPPRRSWYTALGSGSQRGTSIAPAGCQYSTVQRECITQYQEAWPGWGIQMVKRLLVLWLWSRFALRVAAGGWGESAAASGRHPTE